MRKPPRPRPTYPRWFALVVALVLLLFPLMMGLLLGWWGLNPQSSEEASGPGQDAHDLLQPWPDSRLVVQIAAQQGFAPPSNAIAALWNAINVTCDKSTVDLEVSSFTTSQTTYSESDLWNLELQQRTVWPSVGTMALFYLVVGGSFGGTSFEGNGAVVLGVTSYASSIGIFAGTINTAAGAQEAPYIEATVLVHEFGHELGLVGLVGSAPNEDPAHPYHAVDPSDIMYWEVGTTSYLGGLLGGSQPPTTFSAADLSDLGTVRSTPILTELLPWVISITSWSSLAIFLAARWWRRRIPSAPAAP